MPVTQRSILTAILAFGSVVATIVAAYYLFTVRDVGIAAATFGSAAAGAALSYAYWRGWEPARFLGAISTLLASVSTMFLGEVPLSIGLLISPIVVLILAGPRWLIVNAALVLLAGLALGAECFSQPIEVAYYVLVMVGLLLIRALVEVAVREARASAAAAEEARRLAERQSQENAAQAQLLREQNEEQRRLLALVDTLETPAVALAEGVLLAPLVGALDARRAQQLTARLLEHVHSQRARLVVLDIAGVPLFDGAVAEAIGQTTQALRLLGCEVVITGVAPQLALTLAQHQVVFSGVRTARSPHEVLSARLGVA